MPAKLCHCYLQKKKKTLQMRAFSSTTVS